jgi:hypothetical protein
MAEEINKTPEVTEVTQGAPMIPEVKVEDLLWDVATGTSTTREEYYDDDPETNLALEEAMGPTVDYSREFPSALPTPPAPPGVPQDGYIKSGAKVFASGVMRLGMRTSGIVGAATGYVLGAADSVHDWILGEGGIPDEAIAYLKAGIRDEDIKFVTDELGITPQGPWGDIGAEVVSGGLAIAGTAALAPMMVPAVVLTRIGVAAPRALATAQALGPWITSALGAIIGTGDKTMAAQALDAALGQDKFQKYIDEEATQAERAVLKGLDDVAFGVAFKGLAPVAKGVLGIVYDSVVKSIKAHWGGLAVTMQQANKELMEAAAKNKGVIPELMTAAPAVTPEFPEKALLSKIKTMQQQLKKRFDTQLAMDLGDATRMLQREIPVNLAQFNRYDPKRLAIIEAENAILKAFETPEVPVAAGTPEINPLAEARKKVMANVPEPTIDISVAENAERLERINELRRLQQVTTESTLVTPTAAPAPTVDTTGREAFRKIAGDMPSPAIQTRTAPPKIISTVKPRKVTVEEVVKTEEEVIKKTRKKKVSEVPAKPVEQLLKEKPKVARKQPSPEAKSQSTSQGSRVEYRAGFTTDPKVVKVGKHGAFQAATDQGADIVSVFSKTTVPTAADADYLMQTYGLSLDDAKKIYTKTYKKSVDKLKDASGAGVGKTFSEETKKFTTGGFNQWVKRGGMPSMEQSPVLQLALKAAPTVTRVFSKFAANPFLAVTGTALADFSDLEADLSLEDYAKVFGASLLFSITKHHYGNMGNPISKDVYRSILADHSVASEEFISIIKGLKESSFQENMLKHVSDDLLEGMIDVSREIEKVSGLGKHWSVDDLTGSIVKGSTPETIAQGTTRGNSLVVRPEMFSHPVALVSEVSQLVTAASKNLKGQLSPEGVTKVFERYTNWLTDWGVSADGERFLQNLTGNKPEAIHALLVAYDAVESKCLSEIEKVFKEFPTGNMTQSARARLQQATGGLRAMMDSLQNPASVLGDETAGTRQFNLGLFMSAFSDDIVSKTKAPFFKAYREVSEDVLNKLSYWMPNGKLSEVNRKHVFNYIRSMSEQTPGVLEHMKDYTFQAMLSAPETTTKALKGNLLGTGVLGLQRGLKTAYGIATGDSREILAGKLAFSRFANAVVPSFKLLLETAEGNTKAFDSLSRRPFSTNLNDSARFFAGDAVDDSATRQILARAYKYLGERIGITPGSAMRAVDVFSQNLNNALLEGEAIGREMYDLAKTKGISLEQAKEELSSLPETAKRMAKVANEQRAYVGLEPLQKVRMIQSEVGTSRIPEKTLGTMGQAAEGLTKLQRRVTPITFLEPLFSTGVNLSQLSYEVSPLAIFGDLLSPSGVFRVTKEELARLPAAQRQAVLDARLDLVARGTSGVIAGLGLMSLFEAGGEYFVDPTNSTDVDLKNLTGKSETGVMTITADGVLRDDNTMDILRSSLGLISGWNKTNESQLIGGLMIDSILAGLQPQAFRNLVQTGDNLLRNMQGGHQTLVPFVEDALNEATRRSLSPAIIRSFQQYIQGYVDRPSGVLARRPKRNILGQEQRVMPMSLEDLARGKRRSYPTGALADTLAAHGVDVANPEPYTWKGITIDDPKLVSFLEKKTGDLLQSADFGGGSALMNRLKEILSPEVRKGEVKKVVSNARAEALRLMAPLLDDYVDERNWFK